MAAALLVLAPSSLGSSRSHEVKIVGGPSGATTETNATFTFEVPAGYGPPECSLDGGPFDGCASPRTYSNLPLGNHTFTVRATTMTRIPTTDSDMRSWTIVAAPPPKPAPETTITSEPANPTNATTASFAFTASIAGSTFKCRIDGGIFAACTSPAAYSGLTESSHTFEVFASADGVDDPTPATRTWTVDLTAPTAAMVLPNKVFTLAKTFLVSWTGSDGQTNVASFDLIYRRARWNGAFNARPPLWLDDTTDAATDFNGVVGWTYCFKVRATDQAGNVSGFSTERCTAIPLPAASMKIERGNWNKIAGGIASGSYLDALMRPATSPPPNNAYSGYPCGTGIFSDICTPKNATFWLSLAGARPVKAAVIVTKCPSCGSFLYFGNNGLLTRSNMTRKKLNQTNSTSKKAVVPVPANAPGIARRISITAWEGRARIEGIAISRAPVLRAAAR